MIDIKQPDIDWQLLELLVHADPTGRGLASYRRDRAPIDAGQLEAAARQIARRASAVGIITGFCAVGGEQVAAETDGPPSALFLARALRELGIDVSLISDCYGTPLLAAGCELWGLDRQMLIEYPSFEANAKPGAEAHQGRISDASGDTWADDFMTVGRGRQWTHLIAIERPGPSHTLESLEAQPRTAAVPRAQFAASVPPEDRDVCHNMRGVSIEPWTAPIHQLCEVITRRNLPITTIAIGDGGNELGMGRYAWETIVEAVGTPAAARIACRVPADFTIVGGVSDWAGYALALGVARLRGRADCGRSWTAEGQRQLIERLVDAGAVDGVTLRREPTVDALPLDVYSEPLARMLQVLGFHGG
jgi:D-glutamate cyclase